MPMPWQLSGAEVLERGHGTHELIERTVDRQAAAGAVCEVRVPEVSSRRGPLGRIEFDWMPFDRQGAPTAVSGRHRIVAEIDYRVRLQPRWRATYKPSAGLMRAVGRRWEWRLARPGEHRVGC